MKWPLIHLFIELPFFKVRTALMYRSLESRTIRYVVFHVHLFKWEFDFEVYNKE